MTYPKAAKRAPLKLNMDAGMNEAKIYLPHLSMLKNTPPLLFLFAVPPALRHIGNDKKNQEWKGYSYGLSNGSGSGRRSLPLTVWFFMGANTSCG
jgi:hypothetical protein